MAGMSLGLAARGASGPQFDFSAGALPPGATLTRASPASCIEADGRIAMHPPDAPRFDHDSATGRRLGLLVEPATTNRAIRSCAIGDPAWSTFETIAKVGAVAGAAPDGGDATRIAFGADGGVDISTAAALYQNMDVADVGAPWTASFWIRAVTGATRIRIGLYPGALPVATSGEVTVTADRWARPWVSATIAARTGNFSIRNDIAGDSADVLVWGAQLERGPVPTSTIVTDSGPVIRAADVLTLDWGWLGVRDGPAVLRSFYADGTTRDVAATIAGGMAAVPPGVCPLVAVRLA